MNKQEVDTIEEAQIIVDSLIAEKKWAVTVVQTAEGKYIIQSMEHKKYTDHDGIERLDEVWTTAKGDMMMVQDLTAEHAKNIIRMFLRKEREYKEMMDILLDNMASEYAEEQDDDFPESDFPTSGTLH